MPPLQTISSISFIQKSEIESKAQIKNVRQLEEGSTRLWMAIEQGPNKQDN